MGACDGGAGGGVSAGGVAVTRVLSVLALCSAAAVAYGFWLAWEPLGFIVPGLAGLAFALLYDTGDTGAEDRRGSE